MTAKELKSKNFVMPHLQDWRLTDEVNDWPAKLVSMSMLEAILEFVSATPDESYRDIWGIQSQLNNITLVNWYNDEKQNEFWDKSLEGFYNTMNKYGIEPVGYAFRDGTTQLGFADLNTGQNVDMNPSNAV